MSGHDFLFLLIRDPVALFVLLLVSLVPTGVFGWVLYVDYLIVSEGVSIQPDVTWQMVYHDEPTTLNREYHAEYEFTPVGQRKKHTAFWMHDFLLIMVPKSDYDRAGRTKKLEVLYLPDRPHMNRPKNCYTTDKISVVFFLFLGISALVFVGFLVALHYRYAWREMQLPQRMVR